MNKLKRKKRKILVAMSGGVDSSVAAALLKDQGNEVVGVFFQFWKEKRGKLADGLSSAKNVAEFLGIPLRVVDLSSEFNKKVVVHTLSEFASGRTPNPCCNCNPKIKFFNLLKIAEQCGMDLVATGHYARIDTIGLQQGQGKKTRYINTESSTRLASCENGRLGLFEAEDKTKDQSYFLYGLCQEQLSKIIFPLGSYLKSEVRIMAKKMRLPAFDRKESHNLCFVPGKLDEYLKRNLIFQKGNIVDKKSRKLGVHQGLPAYTIGQRKGIELGGRGPFYVMRKDIRKNELVVTNLQHDPGLYRKKMQIKKINWISGDPMLPLRSNIRIRYGHMTVRGIIKKKVDRSLKGDNLEIIFDKPQRAVTPGQSAVFYQKSGEVLGGGIII